MAWSFSGCGGVLRARPTAASRVPAMTHPLACSAPMPASCSGAEPAGSRVVKADELWLWEGVTPGMSGVKPAEPRYDSKGHTSC